MMQRKEKRERGEESSPSFAGLGESWHVSSESWDQCTFLSSRDAHRRKVSDERAKVTNQQSVECTMCTAVLLKSLTALIRRW